MTPKLSETWTSMKDDHIATHSHQHKNKRVLITKVISIICFLEGSSFFTSAVAKNFYQILVPECLSKNPLCFYFLNDPCLRTRVISYVILVTMPVHNWLMKTYFQQGCLFTLCIRFLLNSNSALFIENTPFFILKFLILLL